jgi:hypothetical protein
MLYAAGPGFFSYFEIYRVERSAYTFPDPSIFTFTRSREAEPIVACGFLFSLTKMGL